MSHTILGRVVVQETGQGIPNVIVTAYEVGQNGDRPDVLGVGAIQQRGISLGSASTAEDGSFVIDVADFPEAERAKKRLAVVVSTAHTTSDAKAGEPAVTAQLLAFTSQPKSGIGAREVFIIGISQEELAAAGTLPGSLMPPSKPGSSPAKADALMRLKVEIEATQRFVPVKKERLHQKNYALSGKALELYERARNLDASLPDLKLKTVQNRVIDQTLQRLQRGNNQLVSAITANIKAETEAPQGLEPGAAGSDSPNMGNAVGTGPGAAGPGTSDLKPADTPPPVSPSPDSSDSDTLIPPTMRINLTTDTARKLGLTPDQGAKKLAKVPFKNVSHLVPPVNLTAPPLSTVLLNHLKAAPIKAHLEHVLSDLRDLSANSPNGTTSPSTGNDGTGGDSALKAPGVDVAETEREHPLLKQVRELLGHTGQRDAYSQKGRQSSLYESLDMRRNVLSAADTTAYYDFYDLKIAWDSVWVDAPQELDFVERQTNSIPAVVHNFLPDITLADWQAYVSTEDRDPGQKRILRQANEYQFWSELDAIVTRRLWEGGAFKEVTQEEKDSLYKLATLSGLGNNVCKRYIGYLGVVSPDSDYVKDRLDTLHDEFTKAMEDLHQDDWYQLVRSVAEEYLGSLSVYLGSIGSDPHYEFKLFTPGSVNYGLLINYRQRWEPLNYQVGDLIKTIPLAPKESVKVSTRVKVTKKRARKETENSMEVRRGEDAMTSRAESEIVERAQQKTNFEMNAKGHVEGGIGIVGGSVDMGTSFGTAADRDSAETKKNFREAVTKAAREFKSERTMEVSTEETFESEYSTTNELSNPNEEITVTYLYYELQRLYRVSERLHGVKSVVLVANDVPTKSEIGDEGRDWPWIRNHAWILRRVLLDDSFLPALDYLMEGKRALDEKVQVLKDKKDALQKIIDKIQTDITSYQATEELTDQQVQMYTATIASLTGRSEGFFENLGESLTGGDEGTQIRGIEVQKEESLRRLQQIVQRMQALRDELMTKQSALDRAVDDYHRARTENDLKLAHVRRLVAHLQEFILYYMQAIWSHEPPDQRYLRLFDLEVPFVDYPADDDNVVVTVRSRDGTLDGVTPGTPVEVILPSPKNVVDRPLRDIADLNTLLGFKGNYMIFPLTRQSYITANMAQVFVRGVVDDIREDQDRPSTRMFDRDSLGAYEKVMVTSEIPLQLFAADPDVNYMSLSDIKQVWQKLLDEGKKPVEIEATLEKILNEGLLDDPNSEEIIVPTNSLYIEALPGRHPILEDFKLRHRQIDALKAEAELRGMELDNVRAEARLLKLDFEDPKVDKRVVIDGKATMVIQPADDK